MKTLKIKFIIVIVSAAVLALLMIQFFQVAQIYERKSIEFSKKSKNLAEKVALIYENQENINYYLNLIDKNDDLDYKSVIQEEFKRLISPKESVSIKDTSILENGKFQKYLIVEGKSFDELSGTSAEHRVIAKDYRDFKNYIDTKKTTNERNNLPVSVQLDEKVVKEIFKKSKLLNQMMLKNFRENIYDSIETRVDLVILDSIIKSELKSLDFPEEYSFNLYKTNLTPFHFDKTTKNYNTNIQLNKTTYSNLYPNNDLIEKVFLDINFPTKKSYILKEISGILIISCGLMIFIVFAILIMFKTILVQRNLNVMKNDFISNITHELKTPIATISLACQALNDQDMIKSEEVNEIRPFVKMIADENSRLEIMIERILQSSNLEKGNIKLSVETFSLTDIVNENIEIARKEIQHLGGKLKLNIEESNIDITGDRTHSKKAIYNIIDNAIKYCKDYPDIEIELKNNRKTIVLIIKDKGLGLSKDHITKIFDKLYRVPTGNIHKVKGFGLGLTYTKSIADLQNWNIEVISELNKGTEFKIIINN